MVRHGETDWNIERRSQGWNDQPLNAKGLKQAELVGTYVRQTYSPTKVWSSDLKRCMETAGAISSNVTPDPLLRELRFGDWEGRLWPELHVEAPELAAKFVSGDPSFQAPGGERMGDLVTRARSFIEGSGIREIEGDCVIVSHGGLLKGLLVALLGLPDAFLGRFHFSNTGVSIVESAPGITRLHSQNVTSHLVDGAKPHV